MLNFTQISLPLWTVALWIAFALPLQAHAGALQAPTSGKKGIGLAESQGRDARDLAALKVHWFYNWGVRTQIQTDIPFVPMAFSPRRVADIPVGTEWVLGFNEPDNSKQADISVQQALDAWPQLVAKARYLGAPAMAKNPLKPASWLPVFMERSPHVDFITVHWYKGVKSKAFMDDIKAICDAYKKPVWVTEFAPQTAAGARAQPDKFTQAEVDAFIVDTTQWMQASSCVQRYAWHDAKVGTSALFTDGKLTATGRTYAQAGTPR